MIIHNGIEKEGRRALYTHLHCVHQVEMILTAILVVARIIDVVAVFRSFDAGAEAFRTVTRRQTGADVIHHSDHHQTRQY